MFLLITQIGFSIKVYSTNEEILGFCKLEDIYEVENSATKLKPNNFEEECTKMRPLDIILYTE